MKILMQPVAAGKSEVFHQLAVSELGTLIEAFNLLLKIKERYGKIVSCLDMETLSTITPVLEKHNLCFTSNGHYFSKEKIGIVPSIVAELFKQRIATKKLMKQESDPAKVKILDNHQYTLKIFLNSIFGAMGSNTFRYYDLRIATAITHQGQVCARGVAHYIEKNVKNVDWKYSDTDSVFFGLNKIVEDRYKGDIPDKETVAKFLLKYQERFFDPVIKSYFELMNKTMNGFNSTIEMEHECLSDSTIFVEKKKYVMSQIYVEGDWFLDTIPKMKIKGIEVVRTSTPSYVREALREALKLIFTTRSNDVLFKFVVPKIFDGSHFDI